LGDAKSKRFFSWWWVEEVGLVPVCYCGEKIVFRMVRTPKDKGKQFWGCSKFKVRSMEMNV